MASYGTGALRLGRFVDLITHLGAARAGRGEYLSEKAPEIPYLVDEAQRSGECSLVSPETRQ